jgi:hypothetical protein
VATTAAIEPGSIPACRSTSFLARLIASMFRAPVGTTADATIRSAWSITTASHEREPMSIPR